MGDYSSPVSDAQRIREEVARTERKRQKTERKDHKLAPGEFEFYLVKFTKLRVPGFMELMLAQLHVWEAVGDYTHMMITPEVALGHRGQQKHERENPMGLLDGRSTTAWVDHDFGKNGGSVLVFAFKVPLVLGAYSFTTNDKYAQRDPVAWELYGSNGNGQDQQQIPDLDWVMLDKRKEMEHMMPTDRRAQMQAIEPQLLDRVKTQTRPKVMRIK